MEMLWLIIGVIVGGAIGWLVARNAWQGKLSGHEERNRALREQLDEESRELDESREQSTLLERELATARADLKNLDQRLHEQKEELQNLQEQFTKEFENLANKILDEKSKKFTEQNKTNLSQLLDPLKEKLQTFEKRVEETHMATTKDRVALKEQIGMLMDLNKKMGEEAHNLTRALKGDSKAQGNWGELILEKILESSGLTKGKEYLIQQSVTMEDGRRLQPDVVIKLPDDKQLIVDSKVSLVAYEKYVSAEDDEEREKFIKQHVQSLRIHIKGLSEKEYTRIYDLPGLDFVLMFIPIEPAFGIALQREPGLYQEAFERNIVLVTGSTLLATLRTIANIWKHEYQNQNAYEIAVAGGRLYDKFVGFVEDLLQVGKKIDDSKSAYGDAMKKLTEGRGNLVRQVERLRELGAQTSKPMHPKVLQRSGSEQMELGMDDEGD